MASLLFFRKSSDCILYRFILSVIEGNTTIPVVVVDDKGNLLQSRNVSEPLRDKELFYKKLITRLKSEREAIVVDFGDMKQYIYYDDSRLLTQLYYYPYVQIGVVVVFLLISFFAFLSSKNAEQNRVWVDGFGMDGFGDGWI